MKITPEQKSIEALFSGTSTQYHVPHYQRNYAWKEEELEELWRDIRTSFERESQYFMGVVIFHQPDEKEKLYYIVDGQQRLTTFSVLFASLRDLLTAYQNDPNQELFQNIDKGLEAQMAACREALTPASATLSPHGRDPSAKSYIRLNENDQRVYREKILAVSSGILTPTKISKSDNRLLKCKKFLMNKMKEDFLKSKDGIQQLSRFTTHLLDNLIFITVTVLDDADAYVLFESLNSKGMKLSAADLIKNRILLRCHGNDDKSRRALKDWEKIISDLESTSYDIVAYLRLYWMAFQNPKITKNELYREVRDYLEGADPAEFLKRLQESSDVFCDITSDELVYPSSQAFGSSLSKAYAEINTLNYSSCLPSLLICTKKCPALLKDLARLSVDFLFRVVTIGNRSVGIAEDAFGVVMKVLLQVGTSYGDVEALRIIKEKFLSLDIDDHEFKKTLASHSFDNKTAKYILAKLYEHECGSSLLLNFQTLHLEHILPLKHEKFWSGFDFAGTPQEELVRKIGNMAILESWSNQSASNKAFADKVGYFRPRDSTGKGTSIPQTAVIYNDFEAGNLEWSADRINERSKFISEKASEIWVVR